VLRVLGGAGEAIAQVVNPAVVQAHEFLPCGGVAGQASAYKCPCLLLFQAVSPSERYVGPGRSVQRHVQMRVFSSMVYRKAGWRANAPGQDGPDPFQSVQPRLSRRGRTIFFLITEFSSCIHNGFPELLFNASVRESCRTKGDSPMRFSAAYRAALLLLACVPALMQPAQAQGDPHKAKHIIVIMQENHSFDNY